MYNHPPGTLLLFIGSGAQTYVGINPIVRTAINIYPSILFNKNDNEFVGNVRISEYKKEHTEEGVSHFLWYYLAEKDFAQKKYDQAVKLYLRALEAQSVPEVHSRCTAQY